MQLISDMEPPEKLPPLAAAAIFQDGGQNFILYI